MITCEAEAHYLDGGPNLLEFIEDKHGEILWRCRACGETIIQYSDLGSGC